MTNQVKVIRGSGGGGGGGGSSHTPVESPNSIRSKQYARIIDMVCEGEIEGLVNGLNSVYLDETPVMNADGSYNFSDFVLQSRSGTQNQEVVEGFPAVEADNSVGVELTYGNPIVRQVTNENLDRVRVTISIAALYEQKANGDVTGATVQYAVDLQSNGGGFVQQPIARRSATYNPNSTEFLTPPCYGFSVQATVGVEVGGSSFTGNYSLQYKEVSSGTWITLQTKDVSVSVNTSYPSGVDEYGNYTYAYVLDYDGIPTSTPYILRDEWGNPVYPPQYSYSGDMNLSGSVDADYAQYSIRIVRNSGSGLPYLSYVNTSENEYTITISDKTSTKYQRSHEFRLTGDAPWDIRVRRISPDPPNSRLQNRTFWDSFTEIIDARLNYPNSALFAMQLDSAQFQRIPSRSYDLKMLKVQIPTNYDPIQRAYTGFWDGTFKIAWTDNPAWCYYDLLTNDRYGLGNYVDSSLVDKYGLYEISQYCDELVPNGFGGLEPRFTCNLYLQTREEAFRVIGNVASIFRGMVYWNMNSIFAVQDAPQDVVMQFTNADVIDGVFNYSGSGVNTRHTVALVTWNDPQDGYKQKIEYVEDQEAVARFGVKETELVAMGCTSRGQAHRVGKWLLFTERYETEVVSFKTGLNGAFMQPGSIIQTSDFNRAGERRGGRLLSSTSNTVTLDGPVTLSGAVTNTINVVMPSGTIHESVVSTTGTASTLTLVTPFAEAPMDFSIWLLRSDNLESEKWRVLSVSENENLYNIEAVAHYADKFDAVELDLDLEIPQTSSLNPRSVSPVSNLTMTDTLYYITQDVIGVQMSISWEAPANASRYRIVYKHEDGSPVTVETASPAYDVLNASEGDYTVTVVAYNILGVSSAPVTDSYTVLGRYLPPSDVTNFTVNTLGEASYLAWSPISDLDLSHYEIRFSPQMSGVTWTGASVLVERVGKPSTSVTVPTMVGTYLIKAVDYYNIYSTNAASIVTNISGVTGFNAVSVITESPTFLGTKNNVEVLNNKLEIVGSDMMSDWVTLSAVETLRFGLTGVNGSGEYYFDGSVDLGGVYTSRVVGNVVATGSDLSNVMSMWLDLTSVGSLDSSVAGDWNVVLQIRTTPDDPLGTPTWTAWNNFIIGDYTARAYEFRLLMYSNSQNVTPSVSTLEVSIDMPDRVYGQDDLVCGVGGISVAYTPSFMASPSLGIAAQGLATGDYYSITNKTAAGFDIEFFDAGDTSVSRTFDYVAKGFGYGT